MIQFEPLISWNWAGVFAAVIAVILGFQLVWIIRSACSPARKVLRIVLNGLLSLILIAYVIQPVWKSSKPDQAVIVFSSEIEKSSLNFWKDSLQVKKTIGIENYTGDGNPVYLLGSNFSRIDLLKIGNQEVQWIQEAEPGSITFLEWKGILRLNEMQAVKGTFVSQDSLRISLLQQGELVAETMLLPNSGSFRLDFPTRILGRNKLDLLVNDSLYGQVNFFARARKPIHYRMKFAFPDPEIRFLTQFLINSGEVVSEEINISKSTSIQSGRYAQDSLQFLIIDPAQLSNESTRSAIASGASVLLINLVDVEKDVAAVNTAMETDFSVKRSTTENFRVVRDELEALPFEFEASIAQRLLIQNGLAVQQVGTAKIGLSLLDNTFPIKLSGDSLSYEAIWKEILGAMLPVESSSVSFDQPVFQGFISDFTINRTAFEENFVGYGSDSLFLQPSLVNAYSRGGQLVSADTGWISLGDSLEMYSYPSGAFPSVYFSKQKADFLINQSIHEFHSSVEKVNSNIPDWLWYALFMILLTILWLEPKVLK